MKERERREIERRREREREKERKKERKRKRYPNWKWRGKIVKRLGKKLNLSRSEEKVTFIRIQQPLKHFQEFPSWRSG